MFSLLITFIKLGLGLFVALVIGNMVSFDGRTLSDRVKEQMSHAEDTKTYRSIKNWGGNVMDSVKKSASEVMGSAEESVRRETVKALESNFGEEILPNEQEQLRTLIGENSKN